MRSEKNRKLIALLKFFHVVQTTIPIEWNTHMLFENNMMSNFWMYLHHLHHSSHKLVVCFIYNDYVQIKKEKHLLICS